MSGMSVDAFAASCAEPSEPECEAQPDPADAALCGHSAEQFAQAALALEPRGVVWCRLVDTTKAALYRAFGGLLADFEQRLCDLFEESLACNSVELLAEWELEYGLPGDCAAGAYPQDLASRQALVCAARRGTGVRTLADLQALLRAAIGCDLIVVENAVGHSWMGGWVSLPLTVQIGVCVRGISTLHADSASAIAGAPYCPILWHSTMGGWTGGVGRQLTQADTVKWNLLICLMKKHLPAHVPWYTCE